MRYSLLLVLALTIPLIPVAHGQELPPQTRRNAVSPSAAHIVRAATPATVTIVTYDAAGDTLGQGSGFVLRSDGVIVTCWHVMAGAARATVILSTHEQFDRVAFLDGDSVADVALLRVPGFELPTLPARSSVPAVGERVLAIGSPLGLSRTVTDGIVSAVRILNGRQLVQISAAISPGSSGGPVLDSEGRVFAIARMYLEGGQQLNFAVPVRYALGLLLSSPRDKRLDSVFAGGSPAPTTPSSSVPRASLHPRSSLAGTYSLSEALTGAGPRNGAGATGELISADESTGLVAWVSSDTSNHNVYVYFIRTFRTNSAGQVVLQTGDSYDGYQTDDGFYLTTSYAEEKTGDRYTVAVRGWFDTIALSNSIGLYRADVRTQYVDNSYGASSTYTDWGGNAAVVVTSDSVWIDLDLSNASGGTIGLWGKSRLGNGNKFDIWSTDAMVHLEGSVTAGVLQGQWTDRRDKGSFTGTLVATRK